MPASCRSAQIAVAELDPASGVYTKKTKTYALSGFVRFKVRRLPCLVFAGFCGTLTLQSLCRESLMRL